MTRRLIFVLLLFTAGCTTISPLGKASNAGDVRQVRSLLDKGADLNKGKKYKPTWDSPATYMSPMRLAIEAGHADVVRLLLERGASVDQNGLDGRTPLGYAVAKSDMVIVKLLLAKGADVNATGADGIPALTFADTVEMADLLLKHGADVNKFGPGGFPALTGAAVRGKADVVMRLLEAGAEVNILDGEGGKSLYWAVKGRKPEIVKALLDRGADVDHTFTTKSWLRTPLGLAAENSDAKIVTLLLEAGAPIEPATRFLDQVEAKFSKFGEFGASSVAAARAGKAMIHRLNEKRGIAESPKSDSAGALSQADLAKIVEAVKSADGKAPARSPSPKAARHSDVDAPDYQSGVRIHDFAVVVGIEKYSELPDARFAERDAKAVAAHMEALGIPRRNIIHLSGAKAGRSSLVKYLNSWLPRNVKPSSRVYFYFSGHGAPDPSTGKAYLLPWDGDANFLADTAYPTERLYSRLAGIKAKEIIVALDACFSGAGGRSVLAEGARPLVLKVDTGPVPSGNITVFAASSADQITSTVEAQGHGTFTYFLLKGLSGEAKDREGRVTAKSLYDYLTPKVQDEARRQNRDQTPTLNATHDVVLRSDLVR
ncbi:MAG: ankyrin repeat domain-containing protein [Elusimicrobiota bacterium]